MTYKIIAYVPHDENLCKNLQEAYDNGTAGSFTFRIFGEPFTKEVEITFERELAEDEEYLERRIQSGLCTVPMAACEQLADELEEGNGEQLRPVIEVLRSANAHVRGVPPTFAAEALTKALKPTEWKAQGEANYYWLRQDNKWLAVLHLNGEMLPVEQERLVAQYAAAPELVAALMATVVPLIRLGDFVGNVDTGGASGLGPFDRCAILGQARAALLKAGVRL